MLDVGCGKGYSTLAYAMLANSVKPNTKQIFQMVGIDFHSHFMERASLNFENYQGSITNGSVKFRKHDFLKEKLENKFDFLTFGFEVSLDVLRQQQDCMENGAMILAPLSDVDDDGNILSLEQNYCMLKYTGRDQFDVVKNIMRTAFAMRIDTDKIMNEQLDEDYFNNLQRHTKYQKIDARVKELEAKFKILTTGKDIKLAQLM